MIKHIYIVDIVNYPRGGATANYYQYLASAFIKCGYDVSFFSRINHKLADESGYYKGARLYDIGFKFKSEKINRLFFSLFRGLKLMIYFLRLHPDKETLVIISGTKACFETVLLAKKMFRFRICGYIGEWFTRDFKSSEKEWKNYNKRFEKMGDFDMIFPISTFIEKHFEGRKCSSLLLPCMIDVDEFPNIGKATEKYEFILPANGQMKDSLENMMKAVTMFDDSELKKFVFHINGIKKETIIGIIGEKEFERIGNSLAIHGWLEYSELVKLYQKVHFLLLAREINQVTKANFPSKIPEVMAYGIVPVCSRVGDYTQYYLEDNLNSIIMDGNSPEICYEAMKKALSMSADEYRRISKNARVCAEECFDYNKWAERIDSFIRKF